MMEREGETLYDEDEIRITSESVSFRGVRFPICLIKKARVGTRFRDNELLAVGWIVLAFCVGIGLGFRHASWSGWEWVSDIGLLIGLASLMWVRWSGKRRLTVMTKRRDTLLLELGKSSGLNGNRIQAVIDAAMARAADEVRKPESAM
ncbi:MAG TPA: hypothetical protein VEF36_02930 [Roseiarcus sp.]|nr:hypothetical protein [Roseiarcus sp.]